MREATIVRTGIGHRVRTVAIGLTAGLTIEEGRRKADGTGREYSFDSRSIGKTDGNYVAHGVGAGIVGGLAKRKAIVNADRGTGSDRSR